MINNLAFQILSFPDSDNLLRLFQNIITVVLFLRNTKARLKSKYISLLAISKMKCHFGVH